MLQFIPDQYKTQALCEKAVDAYPLALYCVPDWFLTPKVLMELESAIVDNTVLDNTGLDKLSVA